jgi:hypothetical protein
MIFVAKNAKSNLSIMEKRVKNIEAQLQLFAVIQEKLSDRYKPVNVVAELLDLSRDAAYCRINGKKLLDVDEIVLLCNHFNISFDRLLHLKTHPLECRYTPLDLTDGQTYLKGTSKNPLFFSIYILNSFFWDFLLLSSSVHFFCYFTYAYILN